MGVALSIITLIACGIIYWIDHENPDKECTNGFSPHPTYRLNNDRKRKQREEIEKKVTRLNAENPDKIFYRDGAKVSNVDLPTHYKGSEISQSSKAEIQRISQRVYGLEARLRLVGSDQKFMTEGDLKRSRLHLEAALMNSRRTPTHIYTVKDHEIKSVEI